MTALQSPPEHDHKSPTPAQLPPTKIGVEPPSYVARLIINRMAGTISQFGDLCAMIVDAAIATATSLVRRRFAWDEFLTQVWFLISVTFLPTIMIAIPFGLVFVIEIGGVANQVGATSIVGAVDAIAIVREAAPVITSLLLAGAGGSAICADLGARTIREEISALKVMAVDPIEYLVAPRVLATVVVALLLNGIVAFTGILTGYLASVWVLHDTAGGFLNSFSAFSQPADMIESMFKAAVFGLMAAVVSSYEGLSVSRGPAGVGEAVNRSVVITGLLLFTVNLFLTEIFLLIIPARAL